MTRTVLSAIALAIVAACGSSSGGSDTTTVDPTSSSSGTSGSGSPTSDGGGGTSSSSSSSSGGGGEGGADAATDAPLTVFTIVMENHDYDEIVGSANAPYFNQLIADYGLATNYNDSLVHPSLPNYLDMISGDPQYIGIVDLEPTTSPFPVTKANLGTQLEAAKIPWRSYQESMGTPCKLQTSGDFAPKHDPFLYFADMQASTPCRARAGMWTTRSSRRTSRAARIATCGSRRT